jgi:hypothetical protein
MRLATIIIRDFVSAENIAMPVSIRQGVDRLRRPFRAKRSLLDCDPGFRSAVLPDDFAAPRAGLRWPFRPEALLANHRHERARSGTARPSRSQNACAS